MASPGSDIAFKGSFCIGETDFVLGELRLTHREIGFASVNSVLIETRIYFGANLLLLHLHINVAENALDYAGDRGTDKETLLRIDRALGL